MQKSILSATITKRDLTRLFFLFNITAPSIGYSGRKETRYFLNDMGQPVQGVEPEGNHEFKAKFGRGVRVISTTNGFTYRMEISMQVYRLLKMNDLVRLQVFPSGNHTVTFVATVEKTGTRPDDFQMSRKPRSIELEFGKLKFGIFRNHITNKAQSILWAQSDEYKFDRIVTEVDGKLQGTNEPRKQWLASLQPQIKSVGMVNTVDSPDVFERSERRGGIHRR